jgi:hypothetical protein
MPAYESIKGFWSSDVWNIYNFSRKEGLLYEGWSFRGHLLLRSEEILHSN